MASITSYDGSLVGCLLTMLFAGPWVWKESNGPMSFPLFLRPGLCWKCAGHTEVGKLLASRESIPADGSATALLRRLMDTRCLGRQALIFSWNHLIGLNICFGFRAFPSPELQHWLNHQWMSEELPLPFPHSGSLGVSVWFVRVR